MIANKEGLISSLRPIVEESAYYWKEKPKVFLPKEKIDFEKPWVMDLFCGLGGLSLGFKKACFDVALGLDIHVPSIETFRHSHPEAVVIKGDIKDVLPVNGNSGKDCELKNVLFRLGIDKNISVLMAGIPCQGFSLANRKRNLKDERNYLFLYFIEAVKVVKPSYILIENVSGLSSFNKGYFVEEIKGAISELGYKVEHKLLNAAEYGVPQLRRRVIFIAAQKDYPILWPKPQFGTKAKPYRTVKDAIFDLPPLKARERKESYREAVLLSDYQVEMKQDSYVLFNHSAPSHPNSVIQKIKSTEPGKPMYQKYKQRIRLSWDMPSPTQVSGGIRPQFQFGHPTDDRGLSVRERARIQSIPDSVQIFGGIVQGRVQTGNAVPPLLANAVANMIYFGIYRDNFKKTLIGWGKKNIRKFSWRKKNISVWRILISEILLRKTKAESVEKIYSIFMNTYKTPKQLSKSSEKDIISLLKPLGLSKIRAAGLKSMASVISSKYHGNVPSSVKDLMELPHIGRYIANATVMFGHNIKKPIVDENIQRVLNRIFSIPKAIEIHKADYLWELADEMIPDAEYKQFSWYLLDFAALICKSKSPCCKYCPMSKFCHYLKFVGKNEWKREFYF